MSAASERVARWTYGTEVLWREVWRDHVLGTMPLRVVADEEDLLALYIAPGARFGFPDEWPWAAQHPWQARGRWEGHGALILHRPCDAYTVWAFWTGPNRTFAGWYVNLQDPLRRTDRTVDTFDHELDIWIDPNGAWRYKDEDLLEQRVVEGRLSSNEAAAVRETAGLVVGDLENGKRWWSDEWTIWRPDPAWG